MNYKKEYTKCKIAYKNLKGGFTNYSCSDVKDAICEVNNDGYWYNLRDCEKSHICKENHKILNGDPDHASQQKKLSIDLLKKHQYLFGLYGMDHYYDGDEMDDYYHEGNVIPDPDFLRDMIARITLIEKNADLFKEYNVYDRDIDGTVIPDLDSLQDKLETISLIKANKDLLKEHDVYKHGDEIPVLSVLQSKINEIKIMDVQNSKKLEDLEKRNNMLFSKYQVNTNLDDFLKRADLIEANQDLFKKYRVYSNEEYEPVPKLNHLQDMLERIELIKKYKNLFKEYHVYDDGEYEPVPNLNYLQDMIERIKFIEEYKDLFEKYRVYRNLEHEPIPKLNYLQDMLERIKLIKANEELFKEHHVYDNEEYDPVPELNHLRDMLERIKFIEEYKDLFYSYRVYRDGDIIPDMSVLKAKLDEITPIENNRSKFYKYGVYKDPNQFPDPNRLKDLKDILNSINMIEQNEEPLKKYGVYDMGDEIPKPDILEKDLRFLESIKKNQLFKDSDENKTFKYDDVKNTYIRHMFANHPELNEHNGYREGDTPKTPDQIIDDIMRITTIHDDCKPEQYPKIFNISGLRTFSVYRNKALKKTIYLLGEHHTRYNICDEKDEAGQPTYKADDFFFSLLNCFIPKNNKLDVFMEMPYDPSSNDRFTVNHNRSDGGGYMRKTFYRLYEENCRPSHIKKKLKDNGICIYDHLANIHHSDIRKTNCKFLNYMKTCFRLLHDGSFYYGSAERISEAIKMFSNEFHAYDVDTLVNTFRLSLFIKKIAKQIHNIDTEDVKSFFVEEFRNLVKFVHEHKENITYEVVIAEIKNPQNSAIHDDVVSIYTKIMDLYLMGRVFRSFKTKSYSASNIIIYAGDGHIQNYILWLKKLNFDKIVWSEKTEKKNCIQVKDFDYENLQREYQI
jgi:hypothetical protein